MYEAYWDCYLTTDYLSCYILYGVCYCLPFLLQKLQNFCLREEYVSLSNGPNGSLCTDLTACFFVLASACLLLI